MRGPELPRPDVSASHGAGTVPGAEAAADAVAMEDLLDEVVLVHELAHEVIAEAVGMGLGGIDIEVPGRGPGPVAQVRVASGHAATYDNGVRVQRHVMMLAAGTLAEPRWLRLRGVTDPDEIRAVIRTGVAGDARESDAARILALERNGLPVDRKAAFRDVERLLDVPRVWAALTELAGLVLADGPLRREARRNVVLPVERMREVLDRHRIADVLADEGIRVWRPAIALGPPTVDLVPMRRGPAGAMALAARQAGGPGRR